MPCAPAAPRGLPLLAPWANRLGGAAVPRRRRHRRPPRAAAADRRRRAARSTACSSARPTWEVTRYAATGATSRALAATDDVDAPAFPFPHRSRSRSPRTTTGWSIDTTARAHRPTGGCRSRSAGTRTSACRARPARSGACACPPAEHLALDGRGIPTGASERRARRGRARSVGGTSTTSTRSAATAGSRSPPPTAPSVELRPGTRHYPYAQVWVPPGRTFAALEPMAAPHQRARSTAKRHLVAPGDAFTAASPAVPDPARLRHSSVTTSGDATSCRVR